MNDWQQTLLTWPVHVLVSPSAACMHTAPCRGYLLAPACARIAHERPVHACMHTHTVCSEAKEASFGTTTGCMLHKTRNHWQQSFSYCSRPSLGTVCHRTGLHCRRSNVRIHDSAFMFSACEITLCYFRHSTRFCYLTTLQMWSSINNVWKYLTHH